MIILGIDPGYARAGWGVISAEKNQVNFIDTGCLETPKNMMHAERLQNLSLALDKIIDKYHPKILAIEELFFFKNLKTAIKVAESRGIILAKAFEHHLTIYEFTPLQIKQAITGYGRADKNQIQQMVKIILKQSKIIKPDDAADAIAVAITCAHSKSIK